MGGGMELGFLQIWDLGQDIALLKKSSSSASTKKYIIHVIKF